METKRESGVAARTLAIVLILVAIGLVALAVLNLQGLRVAFGAMALVLLGIAAVILTQPNLRAILRVAGATFFEARRRRFMNVVLIFAVILIGLSSFFATLSPSAELNMMLDVGLGSIRLCGMLIAVFLGSRLIADEVDKKTVDVILAKPVRRSEFVIGKFLGAWVTVTAFLLVMGVAFFLVYQLKAPQLVAKAQAVGLSLSLQETSMNVVKATLLILFEMMLLSSIAITVSTVASWIFSAVLSLTMYFAGQLASYFHHMATFSDPHVRMESPVLKTFSWVMYRLIPHFENFDIREKILTHDPVYWEMIGMTAGHGVLYSLVLVALACVFFSYREF
jgi:ABC-type transport system involved in multi-copper enzyme maturation permease subunit